MANKKFNLSELENKILKLHPHWVTVRIESLDEDTTASLNVDLGKLSINCDEVSTLAGALTNLFHEVFHNLTQTIGAEDKLGEAGIEGLARLTVGFLSDEHNRWVLELIGRLNKTD